MPKDKKIILKKQGYRVAAHKKPSGKDGFTYEIRFRRGGYNINVCAKSLDLVKERFLEKLRLAKPNEKPGSDPRSGLPTTFNSFAMMYFETYRIRKVAARTYRADMNRYKRYLQPYFGEKPLGKITLWDCQALLDRLAAEGKGKTLDELLSIMNCIFRFAIANHLIDRSPTDAIFHVKHVGNSGKALTVAEEKHLLAEAAKTDFLNAFAIALYTGMRPNEYRTARIEGKMIVAINSKRKNGKIEYKRIPISPMLAPYLEGVTEVYFPCNRYLREKVKEILPGHKLYDLRTTFYTRCKECGVADAAREEFVGHSLGALGNAYTDLSDDYLIREAQKLRY